MSFVNIRITRIAVTLAIGLITIGLNADTTQLVGQPFPQSLIKKPATSDLTNTEGKIVLYDFWASWCPPCKASFPVMQRLIEEFGSQGFTVIAVNEDEKTSKMNRFLKRQRISFSIVHDDNHELIKMLKVTTMPTAFLVDREGTIHSVHQGFHGASSETEYRNQIKSLLAKP